MAVTKEMIEATWGKHPARQMTYSELHDGLNRHVEDRNIKRVVHGDLELFNYTVHAQFNARWDRFTLMARGLILDVVAERVVATPFPKFFNYGEAGIWGADQSDGEIRVSTKYDGSLGIVYRHGGCWNVATRGSFSSEQAVWAQEWLRENVALDRLNDYDTYLFEIIYPQNRIVVPYSFSGLVLLGHYDAEGQESMQSGLENIARETGVRVAEQRGFTSAEDLLTLAEALPGTEEGWVIRFGNGHRLKIKGAEYCRIHRLTANTTPLAIWAMMHAGDDLNAVRQELPEEHRRDFDDIRSILQKNLDTLVTAVATACEARAELDNRQIGLAIKAGRWVEGEKITEADRFLFAARKHPGFPGVLPPAGDRFRRSLFQTIRPVSNALEGYEPSNSMNRFQEES